MPLETVDSGIEDLNEAWPIGTDLLQETDDHLRNVKLALKLSFQHIGANNGVVNATAAEINHLAGVTSNVQTQIDDKDARVWTFPPPDSVSGLTETWLLQPNTSIMPSFTAGATNMKCTLPAISQGVDGSSILVRSNSIDLNPGVNFQLDTFGVEEFRILNATGSWVNASFANFAIPPTWPFVLIVFSSHYGRWVVKPLNRKVNQVS